VETAASAKEAQHKLKRGVFEMVITDMRMENENSGYDVIRAARQQAYDPATALLTLIPRWVVSGATPEPVSAGEAGQYSRPAGSTGSAVGDPRGPQSASAAVTQSCDRQSCKSDIAKPRAMPRVTSGIGF